MRHYARSPHLRGLFHAVYNNMPVVALRAVLNACQKAEDKGVESLSDFMLLFQAAIRTAYKDKGFAERANYFIEKTSTGKQ